MLFVTKHNGYQLMVQRDITELVLDSRTGAHNEKIHQPLIMAQFKEHGHLTFMQRKMALDYFDARETGDDGMPPGPYRLAGVAADPDFEGATYSGSQHWFMFSTFNTETDCPYVEGEDPAVTRQKCEEALLSCPELGRDFILVEEAKAPLPWPTYETTHHSQKAKIVAQLGLDPLVVAEYEKTREKPQESVIAELESLAVDEGKKQAALDQLTVRG